MARDASLWDAPCGGQGWALIGDAAGHVHPLTGEGIAYALWSAELLAEALRQGDQQLYERRWRQEYGQGFVATSEMLERTRSTEGTTYEVMFHLAMALALRAPGP
jgi:flavin-dependent dehydrogenase